jgi:hypothetical protein
MARMHVQSTLDQRFIERKLTSRDINPKEERYNGGKKPNGGKNRPRSRESGESRRKDEAQTQGKEMDTEGGMDRRSSSGDHALASTPVENVEVEPTEDMSESGAGLVQRVENDDKRLQGCAGT